MNTMPQASDRRSIADRSGDVKQRLLDLLREARASEAPLAPETVEDVLDRFRLWTGNLGALHPPHKRTSLEMRLAGSPEAQDQICEQLDDLHEAVQDLLELCSPTASDAQPDALDELETGQDRDEAAVGPSGEDLEPDTAETSKEDQANLMLDMVSQCLRALFRIGRLVRKATTRDRFERALQQSEFSFPAQFDTEYVRQKYPKLSSADTSRLVSRLGSANAKRRQFIQYSRDHRARLGVEVTVADAVTARQSSKATTFVAPESLSAVPQDDDDLMSLVSAATAFDSDRSLKLPSLAYLSPDGEDFECPICFTLQAFNSERSWKIHAYRDLKAYICVSGGRECEAMMFGDRDTWFEHDLRHHHSLHVCKLCGCQCKTMNLLEQHILEQHGSYTGEELSSLVEHGRIVPSHLKAQECPFCDDWASVLSRRRRQEEGQASSSRQPADMLVSLTHFKRHVATHQEQLAIFAVPKAVEDDEGRIHAGEVVEPPHVMDQGSSPASDPGSFKEAADMEQFHPHETRTTEAEIQDLQDEESYFRTKLGFARAWANDETRSNLIRMSMEGGRMTNTVEGTERFHHDDHGDEAGSGDLDRHNTGIGPPPRTERQQGTALRRDGSHDSNTECSVSRSPPRSQRTISSENYQVGEEETEDAVTEDLDVVQRQSEDMLARKEALNTTWTRMARKHLSIEALRQKAIEYEFDTNPDYILIHRWIPPEEQEELWKLTRIIRTRRSLFPEQAAGLDDGRSRKDTTLGRVVADRP